MRAACYFVVVGLLLVVLDFSINGIDLLPNVLGWALVAYGALQLTALSSIFYVAGCLAVLLGVADVVSMLAASPLLGLITTFVNCCFIWTFLGGIRQVAAWRQSLALTRQSERLRIGYVAIVAVASLLAVLLHGDTGGLGAMLVIVLGLAGTVNMVLIFILIVRAGSLTTD